MATPETTNEPGTTRAKIRAAQYVRMSTEHQQYSTDNQKDAIRQFADEAGYEIVATYEDSGRSGLNIEGRAGLRRLLSDIESRIAQFDVVLVYDVSRWGRFQNIDESASYEFRCHSAGVRIEYCAEQFVNDGSIGSDVLKAIKRSMAAEHSRVLSVKVFAGQCRLIGMGYRQGGPSGYGLRRLLVDQHGQPKGILDRNDQKSLQTDRVILVPGPQDEVAVVRRVYAAFVEQGHREQDIAAELNSESILTDLKRPWTRGTVHQVLINEKYIGNNVWNRGSFKLKRKRVTNSPDLWVRSDGAFEALVERSMFERAQEIIRDRSTRLSDDQLLEALAKVLERRGSLSGLLIDETEGCPSSSAYQSRFGSLLRAYKLIGYEPDRDYRYIEVNAHLRAMHPGVVEQALTELRAVAASVDYDPLTGLANINKEFTASLVLVRCQQTAAGSLRWHIRLDRSRDPDVSVVARMDSDNRTIRDYLILPTAQATSDHIRVAEYNGITLDAFLFKSLDPLNELAARASIKEIA